MDEEQLMESIAEMVREEGVDVSERAVREVAALAFRQIARAIELGDSVTVPGLGTFEPGRREGRKGIHPDDQDEAIAIPPSVEVDFEPLDEIAEQLRDDGE